jgi:hypothetical protein
MDLAMEAAPARPWRLATWQLFALVATANLLVSWFYNEHALTRDLYQRLLADRLDAPRIDDYFDLVRRLQRWGYALSPVVVLARSAFTALAVQLALLLLFVDVRFKGMFRASLWAFLVPLAGVAVQGAWLAAVPASEISAAVLSFVPGSAASLTMDLSSYRSPLYGLLSAVNAFELGWCVIMVMALVDGQRVKPWLAIGAVGGVWVAVTILKWGLVALLIRGVD